MSVQLWTYLCDNGFGANLIGPVAAGLKKSATTALHHPASQPAKQKEFTRAGGALALVTYKEFVVVGGRRRRGTSATLLRDGEEEALLAAPGLGTQAVPKVVFADECRG
jgi:hypothetical protein